ncbi:MAG TPA: SPOR domain-containing protein [Candidatus Binatia bacterium]|nr:SPOR domain-containing protein [Candidatus Binatia bacterium]
MTVKSVVAWGIGFALLSSSCTTQALKPAIPATPTPAFVRWSQSGVADKRICVLPFTDQTATPGLAAYVRQSFAGHLSIKRFSDAELYDIDARLNTLSEDWKTQSVQQLGQTLHCDALVYGEVTTAKRLYLGLYSQLTLEGGIRVVDAATGQSLVAESYATKFRAGVLTFSPLGAVPGAVMNLRNMSDEQLVRAIDDLGRHLADSVPDLPATSLATQVTQSLPPPLVTTPPLTTDAPQAPTHTEEERYQVQVASFSSPREAQQTARLLRDKGYHPAIAESRGTPPVQHRVLVGPFPSIREAQQVSAQIQKVLRLTPMVVRTSIR